MSAVRIKRTGAIIVLVALVLSLVGLPGTNSLVMADSNSVGYPSTPPSSDTGATSTAPDNPDITSGLVEESTLLLTGLSMMML